MNIIHEEGYFKTTDGRLLFKQTWRPAKDVAASLVVVHGFGEHSTRFRWLAKCLVSEGFAVHTYDQRGHGRSEGLRAYIKDYQQTVADLHAFLEQLGGPVSKLYLLGQNMGGGLLVNSIHKHHPKIAGLILCGPSLKSFTRPAFFRELIGRMSASLLPTLSLPGYVFKLEPAGLSRMQYAVKEYEADPFVFHGKMLNRTGWELHRSLRDLSKKSKNLDMPILVLHGEADPIADPEASRLLTENAPSKDKTLITYPDALHELFNDSDREQVVADLVKWLKR